MEKYKTLTERISDILASNGIYDDWFDAEVYYGVYCDMCALSGLTHDEQKIVNKIKRMLDVNFDSVSYSYIQKLIKNYVSLSMVLLEGEKQ